MIQNFDTRLLRWYDAHGRKNLPWMQPRTPYRVWLSEVMLQQTQVSAVIPYFQRFVDALPDLRALADASDDQVHALWSGLGYYSRARNLHRAARICVTEHGGELPRNFEALLALPGIGRSTAGAILAQAWGEAFPILDGNVKRVLSRLHGIEGWPGTPAIEKKLWALATAQIGEAARSRMADYTQAQMDFGATLCTRGKPACVVCPFNDDCVARIEDRTAELPTPKPRGVLPQRETWMLVLRDANGAVQLEKRPASGVWASLWSLPEFASRDALDEVAAKEAPRCKVKPFPAIEHVFTHFRLRIHPVLIHITDPHRHIGEDGRSRFVAREDLASLGIPAPVRTLLENL